MNITDKDGLSALAIAAWRNIVKTVKELLRYSANTRARALGMAAEKGYIDVVRIFLQNRVNPNGYLAGDVG